jgi:hypothetical protein
MLSKYFILLLILTLVFFIQQLRLFSINEINPNLVLITLTIISFFRFYRRLNFVILILVFLAMVVLFSDTFWLARFGVIAFLALVGYFLNLKLTGNIIFDYLIYLTACHFLFYVFTNISFLKSLPWASIFTELVYNLFLSLILVLFIKTKK